MKFLSMILCVFVIAACDPLTPEEQKAISEKAEKDAINYITYVIDPRTSLCFARSLTSSGWSVYSPVECTDKVMKLVINKQQ